MENIVSVSNEVSIGRKFSFGGQMNQAVDLGEKFTSHTGNCLSYRSLLIQPVV